MQVGADVLADGNMHPNPAQVEGFVTAQFDLDACRRLRHGWGVFRDRRPELYKPLATLDGK